MNASIKALLSVTVPGEQIVVAGLAFAAKVRDTMDEDLLRRLDSIQVQSMEDMYKIWRKLWVDAGVLDELPPG